MKEKTGSLKITSSVMVMLLILLFLFMLLNIVSVFTLWNIVSVERKSNQIQYSPPHLQVKANMGNKNGGGVGGLGFFTQNRWGLLEANFYDYGFDGSLNMVVYLDNQQEIHEAEPNTPDWNTWLERYLEARQEATTGEIPKASQ